MRLGCTKTKKTKQQESGLSQPIAMLSVVMDSTVVHSVKNCTTPTWNEIKGNLRKELSTPRQTSASFPKLKLTADCERQARLNTTKREKYWRQKFDTECIEMSHDDHADLSAIFESTNNVPEHMASLWQQQQELLACKHKNAYRWHPK